MLGVKWEIPLYIAVYYSSCYPCYQTYHTHKHNTHMYIQTYTHTEHTPSMHTHTHTHKRVRVYSSPSLVLWCSRCTSGTYEQTSRKNAPCNTVHLLPRNRSLVGGPNRSHTLEERGRVKGVIIELKGGLNVSEQTTHLREGGVNINGQTRVKMVKPEFKMVKPELKGVTKKLGEVLLIIKVGRL